MRRLTTVLTVTVLAASGLLAGCGGSDEKSDQTTTTAAAGAGAGAEGNGSEPASGSASTAEFCGLSDQLDEVTNTPGSATADNAEFMAIVEQVKATAPDEIQDAVTTVLEVYVSGNGVTAEAMQDPKLVEASQQVGQWLAANCASGAGSGSDSNDSDGDDN